MNRSVPPDSHLDPVARAGAADFTDAKVVRFGAGDMMPESLQTAWWQGMLELVTDPGKLDAILNSLTGVAKSAR